MEHPPVVKYPWPLHEVGRVDVDLGPELDVLEGADLGEAEDLDDDGVAFEFVVGVDEEGAVLVGEVEVEGGEGVVEPPGEPRPHGLPLHGLPELFAIDHLSAFVYLKQINN